MWHCIVAAVYSYIENEGCSKKRFFSQKDSTVERIVFLGERSWVPCERGVGFLVREELGSL